jgi:spore photoproduct lyase
LCCHFPTKSSTSCKPVCILPPVGHKVEGDAGVRNSDIRRMALPRDILDIQTIYVEPAVETYDRGVQVLARHPNARRIMVPSHNDIPTLYGNEGNAEDWLRIKQHTLVLGVKKSMSMRPNERSSNFIAPSTSNGCAMACAYCYVPRRRATPIRSLFSLISSRSAPRWRDTQDGRA